VIDFAGAPEEIRTPDPQIRSLVLYPAELRARLRCWKGGGELPTARHSYRLHSNLARLHPAPFPSLPPALSAPGLPRRIACVDPGGRACQGPANQVGTVLGASAKLSRA
jgi:hypothetical protein